MNQPKTLDIPIQDTTAITCPKCGKNLFVERTMLHKISKMHPKNPSGKDLIMPRPVLVCANKKCGRVLKEATT